MEYAVSFKEVGKSYDSPGRTHKNFIALSGVDAYLADHEIVTLVGPSGCGKSTLLNLLAGFDKPTSGVIEAHGVPVTGPSPDRLVVFQTPALFPWLNVMDNVIFGVKRVGTEPRESYMERAQKTLKDTGLAKFSKHWPYQLSGGMRQRVQIARALISRSDILLLDEPFGALDAQTRLEMQELLLELHQKYSPTILFITHDVEEALFLSDRVYIMGTNPGRITEEIEIPFPRPRTIECIGEKEFIEIRAHILSVLHQMKLNG